MVLLRGALSPVVRRPDIQESHDGAAPRLLLHRYQAGTFKLLERTRFRVSVHPKRHAQLSRETNYRALFDTCAEPHCNSDLQAFAREHRRAPQPTEGDRPFEKQFTALVMGSPACLAFYLAQAITR